jgi:hypothetical protein
MHMAESPAAVQKSAPPVRPACYRCMLAMDSCPPMIERSRERRDRFSSGFTQYLVRAAFTAR